MGADYRHARAQQFIGMTIPAIPNAVRYLYPSGQGAPQANVWDAEMIIGRNGILRNLHVHQIVACGVGTGRIYTLYIDGAPTAVTVTITGAVQIDGADLVNGVAITPYQRLAIHHDVNGAPAASQAYFAYTFTPY